MKAKNFISVGYINIIVMKGDSKGQVQMIGKGFAPTSQRAVPLPHAIPMTFPAAESATGKMSPLGRDCHPAWLVETPGKNGNLEPRGTCGRKFAGGVS